MRWWWLGLALLCACLKPKPAAVVDAGVVSAPKPPVVRPVAPALTELHDAGLRLAWIGEGSGLPQVVLDGRPLTRGSAAHYLGAVLPDGRGVIATGSEGGMEEPRLVFLDGGVRVLGASSQRARNPVVSADGRFVVYESGAGSLSRLERVDFADGGVRTVLDEETGVFEPSVSSDGTWLAYVSSRDGDSEVYRAGIDGTKPQRLTAFHLEDLSPRVSPDGKWIAFVSNREGRDRLFLVKPDGRGARRLNEALAIDGGWDAGVAEAGEEGAVWTPDSTRVVLASRGENDFWHLLSVDVATGKATVLSAGPWDDHQPAVSPDGRYVAFVSTRSGSPEVWLLGPDGGVSQVSDDDAADWQPMFLRRLPSP